MAKQFRIIYLYKMKVSGILILLFFFFLGCQNPNSTPHAPNINWTTLDEPPLFLDCPMDNAKINMECFAKTLQEKLVGISHKKGLSFRKNPDTLYITLHVDTLGQLSVLTYKLSSKKTVLPFAISEIKNVISTLPRFQPAFKTNLEIPVEVKWSLPIVISQ